MWSYYINTGLLISADRLTTLHCYSGIDAGFNNPAMQHIPNVGPIPCARFHANPPRNSDTHGPFAMDLTVFPEDAHLLGGRSAFMYHADSIARPGRASNGCICSIGAGTMSGRSERETFWNSGDHDIEVKPGITYQELSK